MDKTALIFGLTGQDGSYLAELLLSKGYKVVGATRRVSVNTLSRVNSILPKIKIVEGDVTDGFNVSRLIEDYKPHEVYNLAAQSHVATSFNQPSFTFDVNAGGVLNILEAIRHSPRKDEIRFYQASTSEMFGKNFSERVVDYPELNEKVVEKYQDENTAFMPQSPYAIAKLAAHHLVRNYRDSYGVHGSCGILFNHESERRGENFVTRKITKWIGEYVSWRDQVKNNSAYGSELSFTDDHIHVLAKDSSIDEYVGRGMTQGFPKLRLGNLDAYRDWGHAEDYVNAMWLMLQQETPDDYVIATGETHTVRGFLDAAFSHIGIEDWEQMVVIDPEFYRPAEVDFLLGMPTKAEQVLGWERNVTFKNLAERMVDHDVEKARLQ